MHGYVSGPFASPQNATLPSLPGPSSSANKRFVDGRMADQTVSKASISDSSDLLPRDISSRFGLRLRELRRAHNLTQLRMAVDFGIDRSFISDVERGRKSISLHMLEVISLGLHLSLSDLLDGI
jgi:DNA-binding XRE family transcriptional regulator